MLIGLNQNNERVFAQHAKPHEIYKCPDCLSELILKKGKHTVAHFAHRANSYCLRNSYKKESLIHLASKHHIYSQLNDNVMIDMEYYLSEIDQIPDIIINKNIVVEFQYSPISLDLLIDRTEGFKALNMRVIWIGKEIDYHNGILRLSYFEAALINHIERTLITYNPHNKTLIRYEGIQPLDKYTFIGNRNMIEWEDLLKGHPVHHVPNLYLTDSAYHHYLSKCRQRRNVLEPTLSLLYNARLIHKDRLQIIGIIVPEQIYFLTHCITWQTYLYYEMEKKTFTFENFFKFMKFRTFYDCHFSKKEILAKALNSYISIIHQKSISRAKMTV
ncbi:competence protein CoiA [Mammaliicoccus vitulinus]|uniref:competence protein CoiA n=1 Tax=Mammaliicoccus vitulinus TaxID=71237 RepID=UPI003F982FD0